MDTKAKILRQTFDLIMSYGVRSVSMDDISSGIGISKKTLYQYFHSKQNLIEAVVADHIASDQLAFDVIKKQASDAIHEMILIAKHVLKFLRGMSPSIMFDLQKYYPEVWDMVQDQHFGFFLDMARDNITRGQAEALYLSDVNAEIIARMYVHQCLALSDQNIFPLSKFDRSELYKAMVTYHIRGMMTPRGREIAAGHTIP